MKTEDLESMEKDRFYTMRPDGKLVVDMPALLASDKVKRDLALLREKIEAADAKRGEKSSRRADSR